MYESDYGAAGPITAAQKLAEATCGRIASDKGEGLAPRFWREQPYQRTFRAQVRAANALLKLYHEEAVFSVLRDHPKIRSLAPRWVADLVMAASARIDAAIRGAEESAPLPISDPAEAPRQGVRRADSVRSKLKNL